MSRVFCDLHSCSRSSSSRIASNETSSLSSRLSIADVLWNPNLFKKKVDTIKTTKCVKKLPPEHGSSRSYVATRLNLRNRDEPVTTRILSGCSVSY